MNKKKKYTKVYSPYHHGLKPGDLICISYEDSYYYDNVYHEDKYTTYEYFVFLRPGKELFSSDYICLGNDGKLIIIQPMYETHIFLVEYE